MPSFDARLRVPGQGKIPVSVVVDVSDERLKFTTGDRLLGDWPLDQVSVVTMPDGFHLRFDEEEIVLSVSDPNEFFGHLKTRNGIVEAPSVDALQEAGSISNRLKPNDPSGQYSDLRTAIDRLAVAMLEETVPPNRVFATWLRLLKELNRRHGQGKMATPLFYRLNTELLAMMPVTDPPEGP